MKTIWDHFYDVIKNAVASGYISPIQSGANPSTTGDSQKRTGRILKDSMTPVSPGCLEKAKEDKTNKYHYQPSRLTATDKFNRMEKRIQKWINSEEGQWQKKHCSRQYYETIQEIRDRYK